MSSEQLLGYAKAWAQTAQWKPEAGAKINMMRWKRFVEAEDVAFMKIVDAFQKATGVDNQRLRRTPLTIFSPRRRSPPTPDRASTWSGASTRCRSCSRTKCVDMTDVADYLGKKCGGWTRVG